MQATETGQEHNTRHGVKQPDPGRSARLLPDFRRRWT